MFFRTLLLWSLGLPATFVLFPCAVIAAIIDKSGNGVHNVGAFWMKIVLALSGVHVTVTGAENIPEGPVILAANHSGTYDIPVVQAMLPVQFRWIAKRSLFSIPIIGWTMTMAGYIPMDMGRASLVMKSLKRAVEKIKAGTSVIIFPEGTRNTSDTLLPFQRGSFYLAVKSEVPIIPVAIRGTRDIMKIGRYSVSPSHTYVTLGKPITTAGVKEKEIIEQTTEAIQKLLDEIDATK